MTDDQSSLDDKVLALIERLHGNLNKGNCRVRHAHSASHPDGLYVLYLVMDKVPIGPDDPAKQTDKEWLREYDNTGAPPQPIVEGDHPAPLQRGTAPHPESPDPQRPPVDPPPPVPD